MIPAGSDAIPAPPRSRVVKRSLPLGGYKCNGEILRINTDVAQVSTVVSTIIGEQQRSHSQTVASVGSALLRSSPFAALSNSKPLTSTWPEALGFINNVTGGRSAPVRADFRTVPPPLKTDPVCSLEPDADILSWWSLNYQPEAPRSKA